MKLTQKQQAFADYYIQSGNATESAIRAGYNEKSARFVGSENLTKPNIKMYIDEKMKQIASNRIAKAEEVLEYLTSVLREELDEEQVVVDDGGAKIVRVKPSFQQRTKAAELIGKRYGMWDKKDNESNSENHVADAIRGLADAIKR